MTRRTRGSIRHSKLQYLEEQASNPHIASFVAASAILRLRIVDAALEPMQGRPDLPQLDEVYHNVESIAAFAYELTTLRGRLRELAPQLALALISGTGLLVLTLQRLMILIAAEAAPVRPGNSTASAIADSGLLSPDLRNSVIIILLMGIIVVMGMSAWAALLVSPLSQRPKPT